MNRFFTYLFQLNPGGADYGDAQVIAVLAACGVLIVGSWFFSRWRKRHPSAVTRTLTRSWATAAFWFGVVALFLTIARVERIQFFAMRFFWVIWGIFFILFVVFQTMVFRRRHYQVLPTKGADDPRDKYLPRSKRR